MTKSTILCIGVAAALVVLCYYGWKMTARGAYESAAYTVLESDGPFETREYRDLMMATTNTEIESPRGDGSFMRLFRYIGGANEVGQKVAMTTPVFMEPGADTTSGRMGFVIPAQITAQGIPEPSDENVQIRKRKGGRFAVIRFDGRSNSDAVAKAEEQLTRWMSDQGFIRDGDTEFAGYDPPWTPGPLRRNEVIIRLR
jgi:DNA gyrase inhibitor GyrI